MYTKSKGGTESQKERVKDLKRDKKSKIRKTKFKIKKK